MFYDFTDDYTMEMKKKNNALEFANQGMHYISLKHEPRVIKIWIKMIFFMTQNWTGQKLLLVL